VIIVVKILLFAQLRELTNSKEVLIDQLEPKTIKSIIKTLIDIHPTIESILFQKGGRKALELNSGYQILVDGKKWELKNQELISPKSQIAILPPISGG
jgi:molybdopterin converting factor small subunit